MRQQWWVNVSVLLLIEVQCILCLNPVVFIPGSPDTSLQVEITSEANPPPGCPQKGTFIAFGNNTFQSLENGTCFLHCLSILYNEKENIFSNQVGVKVSAVLFTAEDAQSGDLWTMLSQNGYVYNETYFMEAYDWRLPPHLDLDFRSRTMATIERAYAANGNSRVHIIGHSTGGGMTLGFMYVLPQEWKDQYIESIITLSGNLAGEADIFADLTLPSSDFDGVSANNSRALWWTQPAEAWQLPHPGIYPPSQVVVSTPSRQYTVSDVLEILSVFGNAPMSQWYDKTYLWNLTGNFTFPNVNTHCFWGEGIPTPVGYVYSDEKFETIPKNIYAWGDGDQDMITNSACLRWDGQSGNYTFQPKGFHGVTHMRMISDYHVLEKVKSIVLGS